MTRRSLRLRQLFPRQLCLPLLVLLLVLLVAVLVTVPAGAATTHTVNVSGLTFDPAELTIAPGDTVTWVNDGSQHNVVADDGSFTSGVPSTDLWEFSYTFHEGGVYDYHCEVHVDMGMVGTITVDGIFGDPFESGDTTAWPVTVPSGPPNCNCYFSPDCPAQASFCNWGPGGPSTLDICAWRDNKPNGPGTGCDVPHVGGWSGGICDGVCVPPNFGSPLGWEDPQLLAAGVRLWADALLGPALAGGGPPDPELVAQVQALGFQQVDAAMTLGRQITDVLIAAGVPEFYMHFCAFEGHPGEVDPESFVDLSNDPCRATSTRRAIDALLAELEKPGLGALVLDDVRLACPDWQSMFEPRCATGDGALACLAQRVADTAVYLQTPQGNTARRSVLPVAEIELVAGER